MTDGADTGTTVSSRLIGAVMQKGEPMDDLIHRREALDAVTDELDMIDHVPQWVFDRLEKRLKQLSSAQPGWIPTSEKLPEGIGQAIVQTDGGAIHEVFYKGKNDYGHEVWMRLDGDIYWDDEVVAWMPLPTPYLEGGPDESDD